MRRSRGRWWFLFVAAGAVAASGCPGASPKTHLQLTLHGGFGYVINSDLTVEAGFMNSITSQDLPGCDVEQLGVDLKVDDGTIVSAPPGWPFPVTKKIITFEGVGRGAVDLKGVLKPHLKTSPVTPSLHDIQVAAQAAKAAPGGFQPPARTSEKDWQDLFWVPHTRLNYLASKVDKDWRTKAVTGRIVLAGGELTGGSPSDAAAVNGLWEFRDDAKSQMPYTQAITDRLHFNTDVRANQIVINLVDATGRQQLIVAPKDSRQTVGLILAGRHAHQMPIHIGDRLEHFCTFYQLIEAAHRPAANERLMPHFLGNGASSTIPINEQPTPGFFCPGDMP